MHLEDVLHYQKIAIYTNREGAAMKNVMEWFQVIVKTDMHYSRQPEQKIKKYFKQVFRRLELKKK